VIEEHDRNGQSIARVLTARNLVSEADLMWGMAQEMGLEFVDLDVAGVNYTASVLIPEATARHHNVLVIDEDAGTPIIAASNPTDVVALDDLRTIIGRAFTIVVATRSQISTAIGKAYHGVGDAADMAKTASLDFGREEAGGIDDIAAITEEAPIVRYVNLLVVQALNERASDIHVEPTDSDLRIRYRIDGVLHDVSTAPRSIAAAVTTRLKVMADMNIAEHRIPQDGRISLNGALTSGSPRFPPSTARRSSCGCSTNRAWSWASRISGSMTTSWRSMRTSSPSPTGPSWSPDRRGRASPPPSTPR
jgi:type IV pilus assembly protein PilB